MSTSTEPQVEKLTISEEVEEKSVLSTPDFTVVHPLLHEFSIWFLNAMQEGGNWSDNLKQVASFNTVEQFWGAYNSLPKLDELPRRSDLGFFRKGLRPEWEDPAFATGGKWTCQLNYRDDVELLWQNAVLSLIGGTLEDESKGEGVALGVFVLIRRGSYRIQLWVNCDMVTSTEAAKRFKNALRLSDKQKLEYTPFHTVGSIQIYFNFYYRLIYHGTLVTSDLILSITL